MGALFGGGVNLRDLYFNTPMPASITAAKPTIGEKVADFITAKLQSAGVGRRTAQRFGQKITNAADALTPFGAATGAEQAKRAYQAGHYGQAAASAVGALLSALPDGGALTAKGAGVLHSIIAPLWHGSPHKFEKFALDKIGTGEGAQAYGHGLYFAENKDVANQYRTVLSNRSKATDDPASAAGFWIGMHNGDRAAAAKTFESIKAQNQRILDRVAQRLPVAPGAAGHAMSEIAAADEALAHIANGTENSAGGHLYEVSLNANPEDFLNWDAPLSGQPGNIQSAFADAAIPARRADPLLSELIGNGPVPNAYMGLFDKSSGAQAYHTMAANSSPSDFSQRLNAAGIPGIRYLDQGSRRAGDGTRNYVVFDPSIIDILNRH